MRILEKAGLLLLFLMLFPVFGTMWIFEKANFLLSYPIRWWFLACARHFESDDDADMAKKIRNWIKGEK